MKAVLRPCPRIPQQGPTLDLRAAGHEAGEVAFYCKRVGERFNLCALSSPRLRNLNSWRNPAGDLPKACGFRRVSDRPLNR